MRRPHAARCRRPRLEALENGRESPLFDDPTRAVLARTDAMTRDIHFDAALTAAAYDMVSRFPEALAIDIRDER